MGKVTKILRTENYNVKRMQTLTRMLGMCTWESDGQRCKRPVSRHVRHGKKEGLCVMHHGVWKHTNAV